MSIESHLPSRENPSPAQSERDSTVESQPGSQGVEARETATDVPNKEIAKPEVTVTDTKGNPIPNPDNLDKPTPSAPSSRSGA